MDKETIKSILLAHGFTIKPGCDDLADYVYEAAFELLELAAPAVQGEPAAWSGWGCQYPGKMPRLYGDRRIAELNCDWENGDRVLYFTAAPQPVPEMTPWDELDFSKMTRRQLVVYSGQQNFKITHLQAHNEQLNAKVRRQKDTLRQIERKPAPDAHWAVKNPGRADQYRREAEAARVALGFPVNSDDVSPREITDSIQALMETLELMVTTHDEGGWPTAAVEIARTALAAHRKGGDK